MFKLKGRHVRQSQVEKFTRYSIRKVSFGAASVAVATGLFFLGGGSVQAAEQLTNSEPTEVQNPHNLNDESSEPSKEVTGQGSATAKELDGQKTGAVKESVTDTQVNAVETPTVVTEKVAINTASLEDLVAKVESRLSQLTEGKKTKSVIDDAKNLVNKAKELLKDDTKTQAKVDAHAKQLSSSLIILNSIKSETTEEKVNKNQDPRNGQAIPGNGESGFRADTYKVGENNELVVPSQDYTGKSVYKFEENATSASGNAGDVRVTGGNPKDLELEIHSRQHEGSDENPVALATSGGRSSLNKGRQDYPLSAEMVSKLENEARLWKGKLKPDGSRILTTESNVYGDRGGYEFLATEIYKLGYEQGVDRVYIPEVKSRFAITEASKAKGWEIVSAKPWNLLKGLTYDEKTDSIQGRVIEQFQNGVRDLRFNVVARNTITNQTVNIAVQNLRTGWVSWQDTKAPKLEVSNDAYIGTVGENLDVDIVYKDHSGSSFNGGVVGVNYKLADGRTVRITGLGSKQAVSGMAGYITTKNDGVLGEDKTSIPGVNYDLTKNGYPVETDSEGQVNYSKGKLSGVPTRAGIYTVGVYAKDYDHKDTWSPSGHEVQKYITVVVKPTVSVKNIHAYETSIPVTISQGATTAEITLPDGKVTKLEVKGDKWVVADGTTNEKAVKGTELGQVGSEINIPVSSESTKNAATDTIKAKATTESVRASLLRNELSLTDKNGSHKATLNSTTGHWELEDSYKEERKELSNGGYELTQRQVYTETQTNGTVNYYIYSYTRTFNNQGIVTNVGEVRRDKTEVPRVNTSSSQGGMVTVEYNPVTQTWTSSDNSRVTATKKGNFWNIRTESGFTGLVKASIAESDDKASILNNAPTASSTSYTTVKGATVDLVKQASAAVTIRDTEDDATTSPKKETTITKVTVTAPSGQQTEYTDIEQAKAHLLSEVGTYKVKVEVKDSNGNVVTANTDTETGTDKGAETAVNSTTYTITVEDQPTNKLYTVEDDTVTNDQLKEKVNPTAVEGFTPTKNDITDIPTTAGKAGQTLPTPATVTYTKGTETISVATKVDVVVLPKVTPEGVKVLKDSTDLEEVVKAKATEAATATTKLPDGVTVRVKEVKAETVPATTATGVQTPATVVVEYVKDGNAVATKEVTVPVTVVGSTPKSVVVFEGDTVEAKTVQDAVTPGTDGTKGNPAIPEDLTKTPGKKEVTVPVTYEGVKDPEQVKVPVTVLPVAKGEVTVPKGATVDKVKEVAKVKATEVATSADFKAKLPEGSKDVVIGEITEEVLATMTAEKGTNKGIVKVPVTYTVDGTTYTKDAEITVNVLGSEPKTVYTVEGTKPDAEKVKNAVTPGTGGTANAPTEAGLPDTTGKVGAKDVTVPTTVTYPNGTETVNVPVEVLPKATPEKVTTLKDTTSENLTTAVKEKAQAALGKLTLPSGVTVELVPNQDYAVPATDSNGDKTAVPVKVQYKDATGTVVAEDTINVPVTVVSSTPSKIVVFEGETPTAEQAKEAVTPGTDGTKGEPTTLPETAGKAGATDVKVDVPVTYDNGKLAETVSVPVTVLPKASGEVEVPKGESVDKVKEVAKAKAAALVEEADFKGKLPTGATVTVGDITEAVAETLTNEKGTNKGVVNVPATYTVDGKTYNTTVPVTINVLGSEPKTVYTVEGTKPDAEKVKNAVTPGTGGTANAPTEAGLPDTTGKVGAKDVTVPTTVTYPNGTETVNVPVEVLPKATPEKVTTLKDTTSENLTTAVKEKAQAALGKLTLPSGVTVELVPNQDYAVPATDSNGDKTAVPVKVQYKDATGTVVAEDTISVPVTVVSSTPSKIVVFEGEKPTAEQAKGAVTPVTGGTVGTPAETALPETAGKAGATDVKVDVPVTYDNGKLTETVSVPVTVLPKPEADEILVPKNGDKEKAKEKVLAKAKKAIEDSTFTGKLPQGATVTVDETATVTVPDLTEDTEVEVTVKYTVDDQEKTTTVKVPVTVVESVPQIVPVDENNKQPDPEKSIDKTDYPEGSTFRYKTPEGQTSPIDVTTTGDKNVVVEVLDPQGNTIVEVPATVRVVGSTPQFVVADPTKKQPEVKDSITPGDYPEGTTFEYKTPVDTTTAGEKDVTVVAKLNGQPIAEVPAKVVVVDPKTQYVVADPSKPQPDASKSIDPEQYPDGTTFEYKTPVDTTTPGEKDVVVVAKDGEDKLVEVPTKVKVVQGNPQIVPVDEGKKQPSPEDSIDSNDYPDNATFEYKEEVDTSTPGDKKVTVVVKQGDKVLVEVPATVRVVGSTPQFVVADPTKKQPEVKDSITPGDYPEGTTFEYKTPVDTTTAGEKDVTVVAKLNGQPIAEVPAKVVVVDPKTQYVVADPSKPQPDASKSIDPEQYPDGTTFEYKTPVDTTTPGEKDVVVVAKDGEDKLVEVPTKVKVVQGNPQIVPVDEGKKQPSPEDSIDSNDYPDNATFEYKEEVDTSTPGDKKVTVVVKQGDKVLVEVPATVRVVGSTPQFVVADPTKKQPEVKDSITPGDYPEGTTFEYKTPVDTTTAGEKDVTVVAKLNGQPIAEVPAKVVVVDPKTQYVVADPSKPQPDASKSIDPEQYPDGTTFEYKTPVDTTTPGEKDVVVVAKDGEDKLVEVPTKVKVVQGNPQIVPVDEGKKQPSPEDSIDPNDYPDDATFEYKEEVDTSTPGDKKVTVVVKQGDKVLVEVPSTVRVVESYPKYVPVDPAKKQPDPKENINPNDFPTGTTFEYKDNTPVDTTTPGEKPVTVVAKLNGQPITEIPAKIVVVESKTQYVPVNAENDKKPKPQDSITPDDYPEGSTFEYKTPEGKTESYDGSTPGEKDVTVVVKDSDGDTIVEVPAKIKVVQGKEQLTPVNAEDKDKPKAEDSITPSDYPEGSTFEYKVPEGQTTPYDGTTPGDKPVTVVVKDKDGKVLVEVPATIKVVETKPTPIETPVTNTPLTEDDYTKGMKIPEGATVKVGDLPDLTTPGEKTPVKVTITLPNGKSYTVDVPVTVTPVKEIETPVTTTPLTPEDYTKGIKIPEGGKVTNVANIPDLTTPGKKDPVKVTIELPNGKVITVDVPVTVTPVKEIETPVTTTPLTPEDYTKGIKIPEGGKVTNVANIPDLTTPGKKDPVKVTIELPNGKVITVDVPVTVTPVKEIETPVTTTPLTPEDYTKGIKIPEGGKVTNVANIPDLTTPGKKDPVKVTIELPNGKVITVDVPVTVTSKSQNGGGAIAQNGGSTVQIVTEYLDENGNRITSDKEGKHNPIELEGYEFSHSTTDAKGNTLHHYKKVTTPINQEQPSAPETPISPEKPVATPVQTSSTDSKQVAETTVSNDKKELPNTGTEAKAGLASLGLLGMLGAFGLVARKKKED